MYFFILYSINLYVDVGFVGMCIKSYKVDILVSMSQFAIRVYEIVRNIPKGSVLTYKQVAEKAGNSKAVRAVGNILNKNYDPSIPCHRVIRSDGKTGGYNRGSIQKAKILKEEGAL